MIKFPKSDCDQSSFGTELIGETQILILGSGHFLMRQLVQLPQRWQNRHPSCTINRPTTHYINSAISIHSTGSLCIPGLPGIEQASRPNFVFYAARSWPDLHFSHTTKFWPIFYHFWGSWFSVKTRKWYLGTSRMPNVVTAVTKKGPHFNENRFINDRFSSKFFTSIFDSIQSSQPIANFRRRTIFYTARFLKFDQMATVLCSK